MKTTLDKIEKLLRSIEYSDLDERVDLINSIKILLHEISPFRNEPVDCVTWVKSDNVVANDYNPNRVAPPEMQLLEVSIDNDGYTQPIVTYAVDNKNEVIDGFHRSRVGKESSVINQRIHGYLPVVTIRDKQTGKSDRIASTIRHNRARGKHQVDAMSEIVLELKNRNWTNVKIARELGMDEDEILRLCQISGLTNLFTDEDFSRAWEANDSIHSFEPLTDELESGNEYGRTVNTSDPERIFHTYDKWECAKAGFYASTKDGMTSGECQEKFASFLRDTKRFKKTLEKVTSEWKYSCEHYLTNKAMNRIAWLGQAAVCYAEKIPSKYSSGWNLLTTKEQEVANEVALQALNSWLIKNGLQALEMSEAISEGRQVEIY